MGLNYKKPKYSVQFKVIKDGEGKTIFTIDSLDDGKIGFKKYNELTEYYDGTV